MESLSRTAGIPCYAPSGQQMHQYLIVGCIDVSASLHQVLDDVFTQQPVVAVIQGTALGTSCMVQGRPSLRHQQHFIWQKDLKAVHLITWCIALLHLHAVPEHLNLRHQRLAAAAVALEAGDPE